MELILSLECNAAAYSVLGNRVLNKHSTVCVFVKLYCVTYIDIHIGESVAGTCRCKFANSWLVHSWAFGLAHDKETGDTFDTHL